MAKGKQNTTKGNKGRAAAAVSQLASAAPAAMPAPAPAPAAAPAAAKPQWTAAALDALLAKHAAEAADGAAANGIEIVTRAGKLWRVLRSFTQDGATRYEGVRVEDGRRVTFSHATLKDLLRNAKRVGAAS